MVKLRNRAVKKGMLVALLIMVVATLTGITVPASVSINEGGHLSFGSDIALAANNPPTNEPIGSTRYTGITTVEETSWGYLYTLENGDIVEVGDSTTTDFKAHVKTIRLNGVADFSLWYGDGTFTPTLTDTTISFGLSDDISISIYPSPPCPRIPEGGIEYDFTLNSKPAQNRVTFQSGWANITWTKILPLDEEYDQAVCEEEWGLEFAPFTITPTSITSDITSEVLKTREEYEVNSYIGEVTANWHNRKNMGGNVFYSTVSRSYMHLHRGQMTDALGDTAWVEDIELNEAKMEFTFTLPKTWLRNASYPVHQVCGADPAYTEDMDNWVTDYGNDSTWEDYDLFTNKGVPKGAVAEIIMANQETGVEAELGIRTDGSSLARYVDIHEAEGGGVTTCRMFVLCDASTGLVETWADDVSDVNIFYLVGYWENVGFTERFDNETPGTGGSWQADETLVDSGAASRICHFLLRNQEDNTSNTMGVRDTSSAVERKVLVHEPETGGESILDMLTKANASHQVDLYTSDIANTVITNAGYFGSELDFVELFQSITIQAIWGTRNLTAYLDEDGRVVDFLLLHGDIDSEIFLGLRGGDSSTNRYIQEHEAEDDGGSTGELTGFGISAKSNASGVVKNYASIDADAVSYLMGYFKPTAGGEADISNTPSSEDLGVVAPSTTYYAYGSAPSNPVEDGECTFTVTNSSGANVDITIEADNFTGGVGWALTSGAPGENTVKMIAYYSGQDPASGVTLTTSPQAFISGLADNGTKKWDFSLQLGSFTDGSEKTSTITLSAVLS